MNSSTQLLSLTLMMTSLLHLPLSGAVTLLSRTSTPVSGLHVPSYFNPSDDVSSKQSESGIYEDGHFDERPSLRSFVGVDSTSLDLFNLRVLSVILQGFPLALENSVSLQGTFYKLLGNGLKNGYDEEPAAETRQDKRKLGSVQRMPEFYGKRSTVRSLKMKAGNERVMKSGSKRAHDVVSRMPLFYGKRSALDLSKHQGLRRNDLFMLKRDVIDRMPIFWGKRNENDYVPQLKRETVKDRMPFFYGKRSTSSSQKNENMNKLMQLLATRNTPREFNDNYDEDVDAVPHEKCIILQ